MPVKQLIVPVGSFRFQRHENFELIANICPEKRLRGHTYDLEFMSIHKDSASKNIFRLAVQVPPQSIAKHTHRRRFGPVIRWPQHSSKRGWNAEGLEVVSRNIRAEVFPTLMSIGDAKSVIDVVVGENVRENTLPVSKKFPLRI